jgi:hypothetical protein
MSNLGLGIARGSTAPFKARLAAGDFVEGAYGLVGGIFKGQNTEQILFKDWAGLRKAVEKWRVGDPLFWGLGDWLECLANLDLFRDGKANKCIDGYISDLYAALTQGIGREQGIEDAHKHYIEKLGQSVCGELWRRNVAGNSFCSS